MESFMSTKFSMPQRDEFLIEKIVFRHRYGYAFIPLFLLLILFFIAAYLSLTGRPSDLNVLLLKNEKNKDLGIYLITFVLIFLLHSSKKTLDSIEALPSEIAECICIPDDKVAALKSKIFKSKIHWLFYLLPLIFVPPLSALFVVPFTKRMFGYESNLYFAVAVPIWTIWWMLYSYAAYVAVVATLITLYLSKFEINPNLFHPDRMGGLRPIGKVALSPLGFSFWTFILFSLVIPAYKAGDQFTKFILIIYIPLYFVFLTLCIYSLFKFHIALKTAKTKELNEVAELYRNERKQLRSKLKKKIPEEYIPDFNKVRALSLILAEGEKMKEWPLDIKEWVEFAGYLLPLLEIASTVYGFLPRG